MERQRSLDRCMHISRRHSRRRIQKALWQGNCSSVEISHILTSRDSIKILLVILLAITSIRVTASGSHTAVIYFNGGCPSCMGYVQMLDHALRSSGITTVSTYDYYTNATALASLLSLREKLEVPSEFFSSVTTVVDGRYVFEGYFPVDIMTSFLSWNSGFDKLVAAQGLKLDTYRLWDGGITLECNSSQKIADCLSSGTSVGMIGTWTLFLVSGFVNGLNPCALAALAYFVGVVSFRRSRREVLTMGAFYVLSIFLVYLGIGIGLMRTILSSGYLHAVAKVFAAFAIAVGVLGLNSAFRSGSTFRMKIPKRLISPIAKRFSRSWIEKSIILAALVFGGVVAVLEFPCTGAVYMALIGMLSVQRMTLALMLGYNLMFVMPLIVLLVLSYSIADSPRFGETMQRHKYLSRVCSAILTLGLGIFLLLH